MSDYRDITPDQQADLIRRYLAKDREAGEILLQAHAGLIHSLSYRYVKRNPLEEEDLLQEARQGFLHSLEKFDASKGFALGTYAGNWIRSYLYKWLTDKVSLIRVPRNLRSAKFPASEEIRQAARSVLRNKAFKSVDQPLASDTTQTLGDMLVDDSTDAEDNASMSRRQVHMRSLVKAVLERLTDVQQYVLKVRWFSDVEPTLEEVGEVLNLTRERVRQIEAKALAQCWHMLNMEPWDDFDDWLAYTRVAHPLPPARRPAKSRPTQPLSIDWAMEQKFATLRMKQAAGHAEAESGEA